MSDLNQHTTDVAPRRSFFGRIAAMSAFGLFGFAATTARAESAESDGPNWPGTLKGRHRQVFDIYDINDGFPLGFTNNFLTPNESATAVMIFRHKGLPFALGSAMWEKYKIGESFQNHRPGNKSARREEPLVPAEARRAEQQRNGPRSSARQGYGDRRVRCCPAGPEPPAGRKRGRDRRRSLEGMDRQPDPRRHRHPFGNMGSQSGARSGLHLLCRRLKSAAGAD